MFSINLYVRVKTGDFLSVHEKEDDYLVLENTIKCLYKSENECEQLDSIRINKSPKQSLYIKG